MNDKVTGRKMDKPPSLHAASEAAEGSMAFGDFTGAAFLDFGGKGGRGCRGSRDSQAKEGNGGDEVDNGLHFVFYFGTGVKLGC